MTVGKVNGPQLQPIWSLDVMNVTDPTDTGSFITRYALPAAPMDVAIGAGIAFVADGAGHVGTQKGRIVTSRHPTGDLLDRGLDERRPNDQGDGGGVVTALCT